MPSTNTNLIRVKYSLRLGSIMGINLFVHWTFFILIGWVIFSHLSLQTNPIQIVWTVIFLLAVFACITLHEFGHALTAKYFNIKTHSIVLLPIGGLAQLESIPEKPKEELLIAIAGPMVNFILAGLLFLVLTVTSSATVSDLDIISSASFLPSLIQVNFLLALFNLIPSFPMDGGRVFRALLSFRIGHLKATRVAASTGQLIAIGFILYGIVYNPFLIFIGVLIFAGAKSEANFSEIKSLLKNFKVHDAMIQTIPFVENDITIKEAANKLLSDENKTFIVTDHGMPTGSLSREEIYEALREQNENTPVENVKNKELLYVSPEMPLDEALGKIMKEKKEIALVGADGALQGYLDKENIDEFLQIQKALTNKNNN
ncbi:site-2 protease family protein [Chryseolinea sp. H1M3-3]|uniref:site-2 protease family protein n=1 Tax=Chryseolinea sp. H1M3-3 TaxID=3034144 RepID=UPI0023EE267C|nr:site-2 protease family protein [Chryseolinea sp. H1M3-3]